MNTRLKPIIRKLILPLTKLVFVALVQMLLLATLSLPLLRSTDIKPFSSTTPQTEVDINYLDNDLPDTPEITLLNKSFNSNEFYELQPTIANETTYIAVPNSLEEIEEPEIIVYSHGSITTVSRNFQDPFMLDLRRYAREFTAKGYIFAASNQSGANWGSLEAVQETKELIMWLQERFNAKPQVNLLGYSMGGLVTMNYAFAYPETVSNIALVAPTTRTDQWGSEQYKRLSDIRIKVWHGLQDENINSRYTRDAIADMQSTKLDATLDLMPEIDHWNIEFTVNPDIIEFYNSN